MTSLADTLAAKRKMPGFSCQLGKYVDGLAENNRKEFIEAFRDQRISASVLSEYLISIGEHITSNQIAVHRRNLCRNCRDEGRFAS